MITCESKMMIVNQAVSESDDVHNSGYSHLTDLAVELHQVKITLNLVGMAGLKFHMIHQTFLSHHGLK